MQNQPSKGVFTPGSFANRLAAMSLACATSIAIIHPAYASVDNTVTVTGSSPTGTGDVTDSATENVDVEDDAPSISIVKSSTITTDGDSDGQADVGDVITYTYVVTNTGNVTLSDVTVTDAHDGLNTAPVPTVPGAVTTDAGTVAAGTVNDSDDNGVDNVWDTLGPGDVITWTATYTVVQGDLNAGGSGAGTGLSGNPEPDGFIDNTATATGNYDDGGGSLAFTDTDDDNVILDIDATMSITKVADNDTNVAAGTLVTYTYTVTNTGNVPLTNITLADTHKGVPGAIVPAFDSFTTDTGSTNSGNTITLLQPGDVAEYTATYTVVQDDVDDLQ